MKKQLSKLNKIELREVWGHEATDFSRWLSQPENLDFLSEELGIDIKLVQIEANVGRFSVDILAKEELSDRNIIIENQLEDTNHDHLGKIITYASGHDAKIIIWIVRDVREEHQKAVEWLNEHTDEEIGFFLIKIELWQIDGSNPAPKFKVIVSPNEWAKTLRTTASSGELTDTTLQQLDFWTEFKSYVKTKDTKIRLQTPRPQKWYNVATGISGAHISLTINSRENLLGCEIYISKNKDLFKFLLQQKEGIEKEIGEEVEWVDAPTVSKIKIKKHVSDIFGQEGANNYFDWLYEKTVLFQKVFGRRFKEFKK